MTDRKMILPALAGVMGFSAVVMAADPTPAELREQIEALQTQITKIEARQAAAADQQATMAKVMNDAEARSKLFDTSGVTAGFNADKKFFVGSADGKFTIMPMFQFQIRNATTFRDGAAPDGEDDWQNGFEIRRLKFGVEGNAFGKELGYFIRFVSNRNGGAVTLEEAWASYKMSDTTTVKAGQFKDPLNRESLTSSTRLLATDRSYVADTFFFADNYVQGISLAYADGPLSATVAFHDGAGNINNNFQDPPTGSDANYGFAGRVDYVIFGDGKILKDFSGVRDKGDALVIGAGADYTESEHTGSGTTNTILATADVLYKTGFGLSLYGSVNGRFNRGSTIDDSNDWGVVLQAAYAIDEHLEPFARYSYTSFDSAVPTGFDDAVNEITVGANYFLHGHNAKFTFDMTFLPNGAPFADNGANILVEDDSEFVFRGQFQLAL